MNRFEFQQINDEEIEVFVNSKLICTLNHDEDGWGGMERIENIIRNIATVIKAEVNP